MASTVPEPTTTARLTPDIPVPHLPEKGLRLWPAGLLLVLLGITRLGWHAFDEIPPALFPVIFFGPLVLIVLIVVWWLVASRARVRDRFSSLLALAVIGGAAYGCAHYTMRGMVFQFYALPLAATAFVVTLCLLSRFGSRVATWAAVTAAGVCFVGADLVRSEGFSGDFRGAFDWRWQPSAEEKYLADRAAAPRSGSAPVRTAAAERWPGFRGSNRDGVLPGVRLHEDWAARPPREIWRRRVGPGWSSFAATDDLLYTQEQHGEQEAVVCYEARTGAEVWSYEYPSRFWEAVAGAGPRATPTLHDGDVFTLGAQGVLCRLDARTGALAWKRDLREDAGRAPPMWGFASSPLVSAGCVIVHAGGAGDKGLLAYDVQTGLPRWVAAAGDHSYSSPQLATVAGRPALLMLTNEGIRAYDPATGQAQWEHAWKFDGYRALQPLVVGESGVLIGTMMGAGTRRIDVGRAGSETTVRERWTSLGLKPGFNDYVAHKGHLFGFDSTIFACLDLETGRRKWKEGRYGTGQVLLLPDGDQLLVVSEQGDLVLLRANPEGHEELARFAALKGKTWNHPALVGNRLFVRNGEEAVCLELNLADGP